MPRGPWASPEHALRDINAFTMDVKTDGGGFAVRWGSYRPAVTTRGWVRGPRKLLICHEHKPPHECGWLIWLEDCAEGWVVYQCSHHEEGVKVHSHPLVQSRDEANAHAAMRSIPANLLVTAKTLVSSGMRVGDVRRWLAHEVTAAGGEVTFNYMDVYHATGASTAERVMDATNLVEALRQREQAHGLFYRTQTDGEGCLKSVFFAMHGAHEVYAVDAEHQVVELDTKVCCAAPGCASASACERRVRAGLHRARRLLCARRC